MTPTDAFIKEALAEADPLTLRALLYQYTRDEALEKMELTPKPAPLVGEMPALADAAAESEIRERVFQLVSTAGEGGLEPPAVPTSRSELHTLVNLALGIEVADDALDFWLEELALVPMARAVGWDSEPPEAAREFQVIVIGAGMSGINAAIHLKRLGVSYLVLERNEGVGGTWFENTYPGIRADVPTRYYSYSYEPNYQWENTFAPQVELKKHLDHCVDKYGVRSNIRLGTAVTSARWDAAAGLWEVQTRTKDGAEAVLQVNAIITAVGLFGQPQIPDIPGLDSFEGTIVHTSRWDYDGDLSGKRVALIGTGASGMQFGPEVAPTVRHLTVFQRTPGWLVSAPGYRNPVTPGTKWLFENLPYYANWARLRMSYTVSDAILGVASAVDANWAGRGPVSVGNEQLRQRLLEHLAAEIGDRPDLLEKCVPDYPPMGKRFVVDNGWFEMLKRENVDLVTDPIAGVTPAGVRLETGEELEFDVVVLASGFHVDKFLWPMRIEGRGGLTLEEFWSKDGARAYLGMMMPHFPNLWCMYGPNANPRASGPLLWSELETRYILSCIKAMVDRGWQALELKHEVFAAYQAELDKALEGAIWNIPRRTYYTNESGRVVIMAPWRTLDFWKWTREPDFEVFDIDPGPADDRPAGLHTGALAGD